MNIISIMMRKLNIQSLYQFMVIMLIFAITGSLSLYITVELFQFIGLQAENLNPIIFWPIRIILLFIIYQVLLLLVALPFGQFQYFWKFEKKFLNRFGFKL